VVHVAGGLARLADGTLAGSVLTMDQAVRNFIDLGASPGEAIAAATEVTSRLLGRPDIGSLAPGTPADVVVMDDALQVRRTLIGGQVVWET
jgi:N-acetylglucosamine-6-phosphate deacetylase